MLVLDQSGPDLMNPGYTELYRSFRSALTAQATVPITIYKENLDLDRFSDSRRVAILHRYVGEKYQDVPIGVLVAVGSAALRFALERQAEKATHIPIVVAAADTESVAKILQSMESQSVTGRTLQFSLKSSIEAAQALVPGLKSIALVGDPLDRQAFRHHFRDELKEAATTLGRNRSYRLVDPGAEKARRVAAPGFSDRVHDADDGRRSGKIPSKRRP